APGPTMPRAAASLGSGARLRVSSRRPILRDLFRRGRRRVMGVLLRGGQVMDPGAGLGGALDVRVRDGLVTEVRAGLAPDGDTVRNQLEVVGEAGLEPLKRAVRAADAIGGRVMLHCTNPPRPLAELLALMRPGDIVSHFLHGRGHGILDDKGKVGKDIRAARERGIVFDVAHGRMHVNFPVVRAAFAEGFYPDTISSDLTSGGAAGCVK